MKGRYQDGEVVDVFMQHRRDGKAAKRFFKRLLETRHRPTGTVRFDSQQIADGRPTFVSGIGKTWQGRSSSTSASA